MADARCLIRRAAAIYDREDERLPFLARACGWRGFRGGALWMAAAMAELRGTAPAGEGRWEVLGWSKYSAATTVGGLVGAAAGVVHPALVIPAGVVAFYVVESRFVFAFQLSIDGSTSPLRDSFGLTRFWSGDVLTVMAIAAVMLFGGVRGGGFVRSWCVGCLAVVLWYEDVRCKEVGP